jgi:hypothetical protein
MKVSILRWIGIGLALLLAPAASQAVWYAQPGSDGAIQCVQAEDSVDEAWAHVQRGWAKASGNPSATCPLSREGNAGLAGFLFDCGAGGDHFFFRTKENCETFKRAMNSNAPYKIEEFAPSGVSNRTGWMAALGACMNLLATPNAITAVGLQNISNVCECQAGRVAGSAEGPAGSGAANVLIDCMNKAPKGVKAKLLASVQENAKAGASGTTRPPTEAK